MTRAVGNGLIKTLADTIGRGTVGKPAKQVVGLSTDMANIKTPGVDIKNVSELKTTGTIAHAVFSNGWICFEAYDVAGMEANVPFAEIQGYAADMSLAFIGRDNTQFGDFPLTNNAGKISIALRAPSTAENKTIAVIFPAHKL